MYRVLIVNKDEYERKDILSRLLRYGMDISWIGEARDVDEGIWLVEREQVEVVILGIHSFFSDEIKEIKKLRENCYKAKIIVISDYVKLDYAKQILNVGVNGFIQRPIIDIDMYHAMNNIIREMDLEYEVKTIKETIESLENQAQYLKIEEKINYMLHSKKEIQEKEDNKFEPLDNDGTNGYLLLLVNIDGYSYYNAELIYQDMKTIKSSIRHIITGMNISSKILMVNNQKDISQIFILITNKQKGILIKDGYSLADELYVKVGKILDACITLAISDVQEEISNELYIQARIALDLRLIYGKSKIYKYVDVVLNQDMKYPENKLNLLEKLIELSDYENIYTILKDILFENNIKHTSSLYIRFMYSQVLSRLFKICNNLGVDIEHFLSIDMINGEILNRVDSYEDIVKGLFDTIVNILESRISDGSDCRDIIETAKNYIGKNYYNSLTVKDMAKHFSINANYLSTLFKDRTGKTITEYITEIRIKEAIELLKQTGAGTAEIGQCVGYNDTQYFYRVFKKATGKTTSEYRNGN